MKIHNFTIHPIYVVKDYLRPEWSWISNSNGWTGFHLWYMFQNSVTIKTEEEEYILSEGDTFLFDLSQNHHCTHDPQKPAAMFTAYFHCDEEQELRQMLHDHRFPRKNHPSHLSMNLQLFEEAVRNNHTQEETLPWLAPIFHQLLSFDKSEQHPHSEIESICSEMDSCPHHHYDLDSLAQRAGYSKNQFIRLFKQATGTTPYAYLINARIAKAKHLMLFSDYTITQIAQLLGYNDLNHFSAQFLKKTGCYPTEYVKELQK